MNTCLYSLFSSIYSSLIKNHTSTHVQSVAEKISAACELIPITENHFNIFLEALLLYNKSKSESSRKLFDAYNESDTCSLCVSCNGCAKAFYRQLVTILFTSDEINDYKDYLKPILSLPSHCSKINFNTIENYLLRHVEDKTTALEFYHQKYEHTRNIEPLGNRFVNLKGLSSSTPTLFNSTFNSDYSGGGFYFSWNDIGIAVDPGYNFISNMHKYGIFIQDIDVVIVTHEHIDHTCDIRTIDDLNYQLNTLLDEHSNHIIHWYWDVETDKIYHYPLEHEYNEIYVINDIKDNPSDNVPVTLSPDITLLPIQTKHIPSDIPHSYNKHSFGFVLKLKSEKKDLTIGYTSDTAYFKELSKIFDNMDLLIANISSINKQDLLREKPKTTHLGFNGCISLLEQIKNTPKYFIVSEFWCGKDDIRYDITKYISEQIHISRNNINTKIIPSEVDLTIDLDTLDIRCSCCSKFSKTIQVINPSQDFGKIQYICSSCMYLK